MYPENELGQKFWDKVYKQTYERFGMTEIPMDTFNKVWIVPAKAVVYESEDAVFVTETRLKVMLEEAYLNSRNQRRNFCTPGFLKRRINEMAKFRYARLDKMAEKAMREAVRNIVKEHKKTKIPLAIWKDGKVVHVFAHQLKNY
jgi:hypothetical protein